MTFDRLPPDGPCIDPGCHDYVDDYVLCSPIPQASFCTHCGKPWTIVTFDT
jgi:hypothetical protein